MARRVELHYGVRYIDTDHVIDFGSDAHGAADENRNLNADGTPTELVYRRNAGGKWQRAAYQINHLRQ